MPKNKFDEMKEMVVSNLSKMCGYDVENSEEGVLDAVEYAKKKGTAREQARVERCAAKYYWACAEEWYHSEKAMAAK